MNKEELRCSGETFGQLIALMAAGAKIERLLRVPALPAEAQAVELGQASDGPRPQYPAFSGCLVFPMHWLKDLPCDPEGFFLAVQCFLAGLGWIGRGSLRLIIYGGSSQRLQVIIRHGLIQLRRQAWLRLVRLLIRELEKVKRSICGATRVRPLPARTARRSLHHGGRPKDPRIDKAMSILSKGMNSQEFKDLKPRQCWEYLFRQRVCPTVISGLDTLSEENKKREFENLRKALRARGGVGVPPQKLRNRPTRDYFQRP